MKKINNLKKIKKMGKEGKEGKDKGKENGQKIMKN